MGGTPLEKPVGPLAPTRSDERPLRHIGLIAAALCLLILATLFILHLRAQKNDPWKSPQLAALKLQLQNAPQEDALKDQIRDLDQLLRRRFFRDLALHRKGAWIALAGCALAIFVARHLRQARQTPYLPAPPTGSPSPAPSARQARTTLLIAAIILAAVLASLAFSLKSSLPQRPADVRAFLARLTGQGAETAIPLPSPIDLARAWPRFLGSTGNPFTTNAVLPLSWDTNGTEGLLWQTEVPTNGFNSPIIWSNRIFIAAGDATRREVLAFDLDTGKPQWRQAIDNVPGSPAQQPEIPEGTGFAAASMATDGQSVYVLFANGDLAALHLNGQLAWARNLGVPRNPYGHAASLATWEDKLIVQLDQGEPEQGRSRLYALTATTGRTAWERTRAVGASWATPIVAELAGLPQIITLGGSWIIAYQPKDGAELWRADCLSGEITPSPIAAGGLVLAVSPADKLTALKPDGRGDVTQTHIVWTSDEGVPDITTPASNGELVFNLSTYGTLVCIDLASGKKVWDHELETVFNASPTIIGNRLLLLGTKGTVVIATAERAFNELARFDLGDPIFASPAVTRNRVCVRTATRLLCLGPRTNTVSSKEPPPP